MEGGTDRLTGAVGPNWLTLSGSGEAGRVRVVLALWVRPLDGRPAYEAFHFDDPEVRIDYPVWSPDGRAVLFDRAAPLGGDLWLLEGVE